MTLGAEAILWAAYESLDMPVLIVRGKSSDILTADVAQEMLSRNSNAQLVEFDGVGHAPTFMTDSQIVPVQEFLND